MRKNVVVIGGGIIGLSSAYYLQKAGHRVTVLDKSDFTDNCSYGAVTRTLTPYPCSGTVVSSESVSVSITVITWESLHTT